MVGGVLLDKSFINLLYIIVVYFNGGIEGRVYFWVKAL
jgi:hypothetical protein